MVSRQREWQKRQIALGHCTICGKKASRTNRKFCEQHRTVVNHRQRVLARRAAGGR